jgi:hypothetical protein
MAGIGSTKMRSRRAPARLAVALGLAIWLAAPGARADVAATEHAARAVADDAFDLIVLRPAGFIALVLGGVFFTATVPAVTPYHAINGTIDGLRGSWEVFIFPPYEYTFERRVGEF